MNNAELFEKSRTLLKEMAILTKADLLTEDFAYYGKVIKSMFFYLGIGDVSPLHSATFDSDDSCLSEGVNTFIQLLDIEIT